MSAPDRAFRDRIQQDRTAFRAILFAMAAWLVALLALLSAILPDDMGTQRANPLYWVVMLPFAAWGVALITLQPLAVRLLPPALILLPGIALLAAVMNGGTAAWIAFAVSALLTIGAALLRRRSVLATIGRG